jgi:hypothetical protein
MGMGKFDMVKLGIVDELYLFECIVGRDWGLRVRKTNGNFIPLPHIPLVRLFLTSNTYQTPNKGTISVQFE